MFDLDDYTDEVECNECKKNDRVFQNTGDLVSSIVKRLYIKENCDLSRLESDLDQLCHMYNIDIPQGEIQVQKKECKIDYLQNWFDHSQDYLKKAIK